MQGIQGHLATPLYPTLVVSSFKGGVGKTSIAVASAELLAYQGLNVLLVTSDAQHDALFRLGLTNKNNVVSRGQGFVEVVGLRGSELVNLLYSSGIRHLGLQRTPAVVVVDTPPEQRTANLQGVTLAIPVDASIDTQRNVLGMLEHVPANSYCVLVGMSSKASRQHSLTNDDWREIAEGMLQDAPHANFTYCADVLKFSNDVAEAHGNPGTSVWDLPRHASSRTCNFLRGIDALCQAFFLRSFGPQAEAAWHGAPPPSGSQGLFIKGYDE